MSKEIFGILKFKIYFVLFFTLLMLLLLTLYIVCPHDKINTENTNCGAFLDGPATIGFGYLIIFS
jgi:hypothetical protein